jgi:hypothetical protein
MCHLAVVQRCSASSGRASAGRRHREKLACFAERREYYDAKEMPPAPQNVRQITLPSLGHVAVDPATKDMRRASLAILYDIAKDRNYGGKLQRKSATTALCMYDTEDVIYAIGHPGEFPNIDVLRRIADEGLDVGLEVELINQ